MVFEQLFCQGWTVSIKVGRHESPNCGLVERIVVGNGSFLVGEMQATVYLCLITWQGILAIAGPPCAGFSHTREAAFLASTTSKRKAGDPPKGDASILASVLELSAASAALGGQVRSLLSPRRNGHRHRLPFLGAHRHRYG